MNESLLAQVPLFAAVPLAELRRLASSLREISIDQDALLFREGDDGDRFYLVAEGYLEIVKAIATADERLLRVLGPGEFVGEMSFLNRDGRRTASVRARSAARLLEMRRSQLETLLRRHPAMAYDMARVLSMRLQQADNATIRDLHEKNQQLTAALQELQDAQARLIEKEAIERELHVAHEIQVSMLPRAMPRLAGFDIGARMVPARSVGGDLFDVMTLDENRVGIVVGDVADKGIPAALFMALTRSVVRAEASRGAHPVDALLRVNAHLLDMNEATMFVTLLYGILDRRTRMFIYARAGHELPLLLTEHGEVIRPQGARGQALGLLSDPDLGESRLRLPVGSRLLLYTDGVTDALAQDDEAFGLERLRQALGTRRQLDAQALCDHLIEMLRAFRGSAPQNDDMTLLVIDSLA
jgi:phosphoserine phosphatase RsbU/P